MYKAFGVNYLCTFMCSEFEASPSIVIFIKTEGYTKLLYATAWTIFWKNGRKQTCQGSSHASPDVKQVKRKDKY